MCNISTVFEFNINQCKKLNHFAEQHQNIQFTIHEPDGKSNFEFLQVDINDLILFV